jgi:plastocyanin
MFVRRRNGACAAVASAGVLAALACGRDSGTPTMPSPTPGGTTVVLTASGASPRQLTIRLGSRVRFINNDMRDHEMSSDPHPDHTDCPEINAAGFLRPGDERETENFVIVKTCGFHDHLNPFTQSLTGQITVTQ